MKSSWKLNIESITVGDLVMTDVLLTHDSDIEAKELVSLSEILKSSVESLLNVRKS